MLLQPRVVCLHLPLPLEYKGLLGRIKIVLPVGSCNLTRPVQPLLFSAEVVGRTASEDINTLKEGTMDTAYATEVSRLNDEFRRSRNGVTVTRGVQALDYLPDLLDEVVRYNDFNESNDPYGETSYKAVKFSGNKLTC